MTKPEHDWKAEFLGVKVENIMIKGEHADHYPFLIFFLISLPHHPNFQQPQRIQHFHFFLPNVSFPFGGIKKTINSAEFNFSSANAFNLG